MGARQVCGMKTSVKQKLLVMISALILLAVLAVTVLTYQNYRADLVAQSAQATRQLLEQLSLNVDTYLDELFRLCLSPYYNKRVMEQLELAPQTAAQKLQKQRIVEDYLSEVMTLPRSDILRAHILSDEIYSSSKTRYSAEIPTDYRQTDWYAQATASGEPVFIPAHTEMQGKTALSVFSIIQRINSTKNNNLPLGVIRVDANYQGIKAVCDRADTGEGSALYIVDSAGNEIYRHDRTGGSALREALQNLPTEGGMASAFPLWLDKTEYLVSIQPLQATNWRLIDVHAMRTLTAAATQALYKAIWLAFLCAALGVLVSVPLVRLFLKPMFRITSLMRAAQAGDLTVRAPLDGHDELAYLGRSFNDMIAQIHAETERNTLLTRQVYEARYLEREAQYAALCNQIRPHFLFNALNTIQLLIKTKRDEEAVQSIDMLATLLRGMVNADREITLQAEMKIVESYLILQQKRFRQLRYSLPDITPWRAYQLPALTLQPLIENALVHGCERKRGSANITVAIHHTQSEMQITITDNGLGMDAGRLQALREALWETSVEPTSAEASVGLLNIARRIRLKFGNDYGLTIESAEGEGTCVTLHLPAKEA